MIGYSLRHNTLWYIVILYNEDILYFYTVKFTLNSSTRIKEFRGFLSQFSQSVNFHEILHTLFPFMSWLPLKFREVLISILEVRPFDMKA